MAWDPIRQYCDRVCRRIRFRPAREQIYEELLGHMEDHAQALQDRGMDARQARQAAAAAMGDADRLGADLDRLHTPWYPRLTRVFCILALLILCAGFFAARDGVMAGMTWAPFAAPQTLVLGDESGIYPPRTVLASGTAVGGGQIGPYFFSDTGAAQLYRYDTDANGLPLAEPEYRLDLVVSALCPAFWLPPLDAGYLTASLSCDSGPLSDLPRLSACSERGLFRQFYAISVYFSQPVSLPQTFTIEFGDNHQLVYQFTAREVTAP